MITLDQWLRGHGFSVARLHRGDLRFLLEAPCCEVLTRDKPPRPFYVEAERKTQAPMNYKLRVPVHGFGRWKWDAFQQQTVPVWVVVAEALSGELLALRVDGEEPDETWGGGGNVKGVDRGGMVYLRKSRFAKLADLVRPGTPQQPGFWDMSS